MSLEVKIIGMGGLLGAVLGGGHGLLRYQHFLRRYSLDPESIEGLGPSLIKSIFTETLILTALGMIVAFLTIQRAKSRF